MPKKKENRLLQLSRHTKSRHKVINKMDLQREVRIAVTEKKTTTL